MAEQLKARNVKPEDVPISGQDAELALRMAIKMLNEGNGLQIIRNAIDKSQDPALVIGQFLAQLMGKLGEKLAQEVGLDPRVFLAKGGFLEKILDYIEVKLGLAKEFSDEVYGTVLETIKAAAMERQGPVQGQPGPQGPAGPQRPMGGSLDGSR